MAIIDKDRQAAWGKLIEGMRLLADELEDLGDGLEDQRAIVIALVMLKAVEETREILSAKQVIVRAMPRPPVMVGEGPGGGRFDA